MAYRFQLPHMTSPKPKRKATFGAVIKPPTPTPAAPAPLPVDPAYDAQVAGLARTRDDTLAGLGTQRTAALANYGYNAQYDPSGGVSGLTVDPSNPFSRAALLTRNYQQSKAGTTNSLASRGQLYSGAMQTAQNANDFGYLQGQDNLQKQLTALLADISSRGTQANTGYETGVSQAMSDRLSRAPDNPLYSPAPSVASPPPFTAREGTDSKGNSGVWHIYPGRKPVFVRKGTR